ncbi:SRPBCC family protein [Luteococcus peritonei]|uniref:SRPBCC family protein n=1 Tax=Luteococcus peritonei TaxID=88874 RepID=A0ABW4RW09_9ACTN
MSGRSPATGRLPVFQVELSCPQPPELVWQKLWDLERHSLAVPLTRVRAEGSPELRRGSHFVARTGVGPLALDDWMTVREWSPPTRARIEKTGPLLHGTITVELSPTGTGTRLTWRQGYGARGLPAVMARALVPFVARGYRVALGRILS